MSEFIIFCMIMGLIAIAAVIDIVITYVERVQSKRRYQRVKFLASHPKYAENPDGTLEKIK